MLVFIVFQVISQSILAFQYEVSHYLRKPFDHSEAGRPGMWRPYRQEDVFVDWKRILKKFKDIQYGLGVELTWLYFLIEDAK